MKPNRLQLAKQSRFFRRLHKFVAIPLAVFMLVLGLTGLLLTWKSELKLAPPSQELNNKTNHLISLSEIENIAYSFADSLVVHSEIERIDYRPSKGIAKVRFESHITELQINCFTGEIISVKNRTSDIIEMIHDGSIIDFLIKSNSENTKLVYSTFTSLGLILLAITGFMMWRNPKRMRKLKS